MRERIPQTSFEIGYHATVNIQGMTGRTLRLIWNTVHSSDKGHKYGEGGAGRSQVIKGLGGDVLYVSAYLAKSATVLHLVSKEGSLWEKFIETLRKKNLRGLQMIMQQGSLASTVRSGPTDSILVKDNYNKTVKKIAVCWGRLWASEVGKGTLSGAEWERGQWAMASSV